VPDDRTAQADRQRKRQVVFLSFLAFALVIGLYLSLFTGSPAATRAPEPEEAGQEAQPEPAEPAEASEPAEPGDAASEDGAAQNEEAEEAAEDAEEAEQGEDEDVLADAPEPSATTVQVLDAGGGRTALRAAAAALEDLGYDVVNTTDSRTDVSVTTVLYVGGDDTAARALRQRDGRFADVDANQAFSDAVDLHVLVGSDWS
jgi:uncharacterized iron-regulated membrane protein